MSEAMQRGIVTVRDEAVRNRLVKCPGMLVYRVDLRRLEICDPGEASGRRALNAEAEA